MEDFVSGTSILVLASHTIPLLEEWCNRAILLDHGRITAYRSASGFGIRLDAGSAFAGAVITPFYDSLLVKVTSWGSSFPVAVRRMLRTLAAMRGYFLPKSRFMFARPLTAMSSRFGSIFRQMAAARAITLTSVVNDSITTSPLYLIAFRAAATAFQSM